MRSLIFIIFTAIFSVPSFAQWYETQGHAIINSSKMQARTKAIENALKKALLVAGASVSSVQQVVNGLLMQDEINIRASGEVNSFELIDELYSGNVVTVTIRADIFPKERQCFSADYRKSLLITKSHIKNREQANIGGIYSLDKVLVKRLAKKINADGLYLDTKLALKNNTEFSRYNNSLQADKIKKLTMSLSDLSGSQYVLFSEINDISFANVENNSWQFWQEDIYDRHFNFSIYIYNGSNGELVFNQNYKNSAPWHYSIRDQIDVNSNTFWQGEYGNIINQTLNAVITDIDDNMMCQPTRGKIVKVSGNEVMINLGKRQGVKEGDEFSLLHTKNITSDLGKVYAGFNISPFTVKIIQVSEESALAVSSKGEMLDNIQQDDLAVRY
ncbi:flagella assembly protein FlgT [Thalassotalea castellviae]|uniref:Flagellar assembly protein T N-terminal domain-containing protein n=1 Tax=Thalassotalea castellviae TaxID=3075612 RepID=A0ABU2ZY92_9GAMM|nr:flagellar assembly protein T N-terminal domain-containing protein [Thalassotalea sp. W431]MDT0602890.1 flagellar assembly protein T N-terminal domain-containing protein [Thalassotalea sp. W431]